MAPSKFASPFGPFDLLFSKAIPKPLSARRLLFSGRFATWLTAWTGGAFRIAAHLAIPGNIAAIPLTWFVDDGGVL